MMIALLAYTMILSSPQTAAPSGPDLFNKMLNRYYTAKTIQGTVEWIQSAPAANIKVSTMTTVVAQQPNLFLFEQARAGVSPFRAASDGKKMAYSVPKDWQGRAGNKPYVYETAPTGIDGGFNVFSPLLLDKQFPVLVSLYNAYEIGQFVKRVRNLRFDAEVEYAGVPAYRLVAAYVFSPGRPDRNIADILIPVYFFVSKTDDLLGMVWQETVAGGGVSYTIQNELQVRIKVNEPIEPGTFKLP